MEKTILLVHVDVRRRTAIRDTLAACGIEAIEASSPAEAMSLVRDQRIDGLVISDDARQLALRGLSVLVHKSSPDAPIFVLLNPTSDQARIKSTVGEQVILLSSDASPEQVASRVTERFGHHGPRIWGFEKVRSIRRSRLWEVHLARDLTGPRVKPGARDGTTKPAEPAKAPRWVMLTQLSDTFARDEDLRAEFIHGASLVATLQHPNLPAVREVGGAHDIPFIASEYLKGATLLDAYSRFRDTGAWPSPRLAAWIALQLAAALEHAHASGIAHGALSPESVWLTVDGSVLLLHLGIAGHCAALERSMRASTGIAVSKLYLAPEQLKQEHADARTDVFLLGIILNELLSRQPLALRDDAAHEGPRSAVRPEPAPEKLTEITLRCLERNPSFRPQSARSICQALLEAVQVPTLTHQAAGASSRGKSAPEQELAELLRQP